MSGGILGVNLVTYVVDKVEVEEFFIKFYLITKVDGFRWILMVVYGAAQQDRKGEFLAELVRSCSSCENSPFMVGGDFNIIRNPSEKNNNRYNWPRMFNTVIETLNLKEIEMSGRKYTWANYAEVPTYEKLDRILVSTEWELKFPLVKVQALSREISDHTPLLLSSGDSLHRATLGFLSLS